MQILTKKLTAGESFTLTADYKAQMLSFQMSADSGDNGTYQGSAVDPVTAAASTVNPLAAGQGRVFTDPQLVQGVIINCVQGTISIDIGY